MSHVNPNLLYFSGDFEFTELVKRITDGKLALIHDPPLGRTDPDMIETWVSKQWILGILEAREIVAECLKVFDERYHDIAEDKWRASLYDELTKTMRNVMQYPAIMDDYRRFVTIVGRGDAPSYWTKSEVSSLLLFVRPLIEPCT
jgi:hypothetical protein